MTIDTLMVERAIDSWKHWDIVLKTRPSVAGKLEGGSCNHSFMLVSGQARMVLRMNGPASPLPGYDRGQEAGIWRMASLQGIAPALFHADPATGFIVSEYIDNRVPELPTDDTALLDSIFGLMERCHDLTTGAAAIDYQAHVDHYWRLVETRGHGNPALPEQRSLMREILEELNAPDTQRCLCHHDPIKANFVGGPDRLYLIDWEYAAIGLPIMDYAAIAVEWGVSDAIVVSRTGVDARLLGLAKTHYRYLCALWEEVCGCLYPPSSRT